jgi:TRAP-type uncharacterized transport system substrate-binding protein
MNVVLLYRRRWGLFYLPVLALGVIAIIWVARVAMPLPPRNVTIAAGSPQGNYVQLALRYREALERRGITVDISTSELGAAGPIQRLASPLDPAQAGFAHGLLADMGPERADQAPVQALAVIGKQPVWIFTRVQSINSVSQLRALRIAAGPPGTPQRRLAGLLLSQAQVRENDVIWDDKHQGLAAANELLEGKIDAVITIGSGDSPTVRLLSRSTGIYMLGVDRANALAAREPRLQAIVLPQGAIELRGDVPPRDLTMVYTGTHLLVRASMHPALQRAFMDAASDIHSVPTFLQRQSEYPAIEASDFPLSPHAQRQALGYRPWLEAALPYWWAQLAELLLYAVLPIVLITVAALIWIPQFFSLRVNAVLSHYYGELKFLENDIDNAGNTPMAMPRLLAQLDAIEQQVSTLDLPDRYADRWYTLRQHLIAARERLLGMRAR